VTDSARRRRVEELCDAALGCPPGDRAAFLAEACAGDDALRRDVEALLAHAPRAEGFLEGSVGAVAASVLAEPSGALAGRQIGSYRIVSLLGAGGMGEVYRAHDSRLRRDVAVKLLPSSVAADPARIARFEREARMLAALNHPHIAAIYGLEEQTDVASGFSRTIRALVLELVEGPTLAERLRAGPIPITEALTIATQIAEALEAAHEKGIVHRDLKPANIKATPAGTVKVLDFGLAKAFAADASTNGAPTVTLDRTGEGVLVGTPAYMSPEQVSGQPVDKRADIWAFGCVLYEMLVGAPAFAGAGVSEVLGAVLKSDVAWNALPSEIPARVRTLLRRCLQKDPRQLLRGLSLWQPQPRALPCTSGNQPNPRRPCTRARFCRRRKPPSSLTQARFCECVAALSPDGRWIVYVSDESGRNEVYVVPFPGPGGRWQVSTAGGHWPRWRRDGREIFYLDPTTRLMAADVDGRGAEFDIGAVRPLFEARLVLNQRYMYDVSPDGQRFPVNTLVDTAPQPITLVVNWPALLKN